MLEEEDGFVPMDRYPYRLIKPGAGVFLPEAYEIIYGTVIGSLRMWRKITCWQLSHFTMVMQAITTFRMLAAGIRTITVLSVLLLFTLHL